MIPRAPIRVHAACVLLLAAAVAAAWHPVLGHFFYSDDFAMLLRGEERGFGDVVRRDLFGTDWPFWRPGWYLLWEAAHRAFGLDPHGYMALGLSLHLGAVVLAYAIAWAATHRASAALAAGLLLATSPAVAEAVAWPAAATNVVPAAMLLSAACWSAWRFAGEGGRRRWLACLLLFCASMGFKEAAYCYPLVWLAACALGAQNRRTALRRAAAGLPFAVLVLLHFRFLSRGGAPPLPPLELVRATLHHLASFGRDLVDVAWGDTVVLACGALVAALGFRLAPPAGRFLLAWSLLATFPYVTSDHSSRFAYFFHVPLAAFAATLVARCARFREGVAVAASLAILLAAVNATRVPRALAPHRDAGETCRRTVAWAVDLPLHGRERFVFDLLPPALQNGMPELLALWLGRRFEVVELRAVPRPPFLAWLDPAFETLHPDDEVFRWDAAVDGFRAGTKRELVGDLWPMPWLSFPTSAVVAGDEARARELLAASFDPRRVVLFAEPPVAIDPAAAARSVVLGFGGRLPVVSGEVECAGDVLLVVCFPVAVDFTAPGAAIVVDERPVQVLKANLQLDAVPLRVGRHRIEFRLPLQ